MRFDWSIDMQRKVCREYGLGFLLHWCEAKHCDLNASEMESSVS